MGRHRTVSLALVAPAAILCLAACNDESTKPDPTGDGADRAALMRLYSVTYGPGWTQSDGWGGDAPLETWYGVETDGSGRVVGLDLGGVWDADIGGWISQGLIGPIPAELGDLAHLETLALGRNTLKGPIPPELANLSRLTRLDLGYNSLIGPIPPELADLTLLAELNLQSNDLSGEVPSELATLSGLVHLRLAQNDLSGPIPPELANLSSMETLSLSGNSLTGEIPAELAELAGLTYLSLGGNRLSGPVPPALGRLVNLDWLLLAGNSLSGTIPPELGDLAGLTGIYLHNNELEGAIPPELGNMAGLERLYLAGNALTGAIPPELGDLASLAILWLSDNELTGAIPPELGSLSAAWYLGLNRNSLTGPIPPELGGLAALEQLHLERNDLEGPVPSALGAMPELRRLGLTDNPALEGPLPTELASLRRLDAFLAGGTGLCAPADPVLEAWLAGIHKRRVARCSPEDDRAYLVQAVQSREFPVPLVAGREALLRVFVTQPNATAARMPTVRARLFHGGAEVHVEDIPGRARSIPTEVDESSLSSSVNATMPGELVQPGLEMVIEVDPDGTLDPEIGVVTRIPATGRLAVDVGAVPILDLTLVPFAWEGGPDYGIVGTVLAMAADPDNHDMLRESRTLLPVGELAVKAHEMVRTNTNDAYALLRETTAIRAMEGGTGHYMGMMSPPVTGAGGVAWLPGRSSFSQPYADIVAHELGHNLSLSHAPCGGAGSPDVSFPEPDGSIGVWGLDLDAGPALVAPTMPDIMSYCEPAWISEYHFSNALRFRLSEADSAGLPRVASSTRALLLWGGVDADGAPFLEPAFVIDAPPALPPAGGEFRLAGRTANGTELFSLGFDMPEMADGDGGSGFVFALPAADGWEETLAVITLAGPGGSVALDAASELSTAVLRDPGSGQVRGILRDLPATVLTRADAAAALSPEPGIAVLFSRGIPAADAWRR